MEAISYISPINPSGYLSIIQSGLEFIEARKHIQYNSKIFIKPNLTFPSYQPGVMTSPQAVEAAIIALLDYTPNIFIGDLDSGGYNRFSMNRVYSDTGIQEFADKHGVKVVNLSDEPTTPIQFQYKRKYFSLALPRLLTDEIDLTITMPVPKVHLNSGVSLTFKNQWGCIPENKDRLSLHPYLHHVILEVCKSVKAKLAIIDGTYGLNVSGPLRGVPVRLDWLLVADNLGAGARITCDLMQIPLDQIPHLSYADRMGLIPSMDEITLNDDLVKFRKDRFYLKRKWTDLPGVLAYHSPLIAYLGYFSPLAHILHRILYLFREPFYDYDEYVIDK